MVTGDFRLFDCVEIKIIRFDMRENELIIVRNQNFFFFFFFFFFSKCGEQKIRKKIKLILKKFSEKPLKLYLKKKNLLKIFIYFSPFKKSYYSMKSKKETD